MTAVLAVLVVGLGYSAWNKSSGGIDGDAGTLLSTGNCGDIDVALDLTGVDSGITVNDDDPDNQVLTVTSADLNSANDTAISFTISLRRTDTCAGLTNAGENFLIREVGAPEGCRAYTSYSDGTKDQYTCDLTSDNYFNYTIGGVQGKNGAERYYDLVALDQTSNTAVTVVVDDSTTFDSDLVKNSYDVANLAKFEISNPSMKKPKTITIQYLKS